MKRQHKESMNTKFRRGLAPLLMSAGLLLSAGAPAQGGGDYQIKAGDVLAISVWKEKDLMQEVLVRPDGKFSYPLTGDIVAKGRTVEDIRAQIVEKIQQFIPDPVVTVQVREIIGNQIYVIGKVNKPGAFLLNRDIDVMQALSMAGGAATFADLGDIRILRRESGQQQSIPFNYSQVERGKGLEQNILLLPGDVVVVP
jgi:polysaccharide export outer membrane protein